MVKRHIPPHGRERRVPGLRERCQEGFELLCGLLQRAGHRDLLARLGGHAMVDDVLRLNPESVPLLLEAAWELRGERRFRDLFRHQDTGQLVHERDDPIGPCGRTFNQVYQAHLYGAARLYFSRCEKEWALQYAKKEERAHHKAEAARRKSLGGRLMGALRDQVDAPPTFPYQNYRALYPGHGLYDALKPYLSHPWQFALIPHYARLRTRQVVALGDLISQFDTPERVNILADLDEGDIGVIRGAARAFAAAQLGIEPRPSHAARPRSAAEAEAETTKRAALQAEERRVFERLLTDHLECLPRIREAGSTVETTIRRLAPVFGEDLWALFGDERRLQNAINCPDLVLDIVGPVARAIPPEVSTILMSVHDKQLLKDILRLTVEAFPAEDLERYFADPARRPVWNSLPAKFNNNYHYEANAPNDALTVKNHENLKTVCTGIFSALRSGKMET